MAHPGFFGLSKIEADTAGEIIEPEFGILLTNPGNTANPLLFNLSERFSRCSSVFHPGPEKPKGVDERQPRPVCPFFSEIEIVPRSAMAPPEVNRLGSDQEPGDFFVSTRIRMQIFRVQPVKLSKDAAQQIRRSQRGRVERYACDRSEISLIGQKNAEDRSLG